MLESTVLPTSNVIMRLFLVAKVATSILQQIPVEPLASGASSSALTFAKLGLPSPSHGFFHAELHGKTVTLWSKEVWKLNFRQYGKMEMAQQGRNSDVEKVRSEKIRDGEDQRWRKSEERRCRCAKR